MGDYIATFFSHFGAMSFKKKCEKEGYPATIMPVPRNLSSSCGTCVKFTGEAQTAQNWNSDEVEQLVKILEIEIPGNGSGGTDSQISAGS